MGVPSRIGPTRLDRIYRRDGGRCVYCGVTLAKEDVTLDHYKPKRYGGGYEDDNLVVSCGTCNNRKADTDGDTFLKRMGRGLKVWTPKTEL